MSATQLPVSFPGGLSLNKFGVPFRVSESMVLVEASIVIPTLTLFDLDNLLKRVKNGCHLSCSNFSA